MLVTWFPFWGNYQKVGFGLAIYRRAIELDYGMPLKKIQKNQNSSDLPIHMIDKHISIKRFSNFQSSQSTWLTIHHPFRINETVRQLYRPLISFITHIHIYIIYIHSTTTCLLSFFFFNMIFLLFFPILCYIIDLNVVSSRSCMDFEKKKNVM